MCFACDDRLHSNIDLVMQVEQCTLQEALEWFDEHYPGIPRIKTERTGRNTFDFRAGVDEFQSPDDLVRAGIVPHLTDSSLRVFTVLGAFRDSDNQTRISYATIKLRTGIRSNTTVASAVRHLEELSIMKASRKWARGRAGRDQNQYAFTFDDPALFQLLTERAEGQGDRYLGNTSPLAIELKPPSVSAISVEHKPPVSEVPENHSEPVGTSTSDEEQEVPEDPSEPIETRWPFLKRHKLTAAEVDEIRRLWATGNYTKTELAHRFEVSPQTIASRLKGVEWGSSRDLSSISGELKCGVMSTVTEKVLEAKDARS
jgi:hypothetical protein